MVCIYTYASIPVEPMHVDVCAPGCVCVLGGGGRGVSGMYLHICKHTCRTCAC